VRLYYVDSTSQLVEMAADCSSPQECKWKGDKSLERTGLANDTALAVAFWGNTTTGLPPNIDLFYTNDDDYLQKLAYSNSDWLEPDTPGMIVGRYTGIAAGADRSEDAVERVFYADPNNNLIGLRSTPGYAFDGRSYNGRLLPRQKANSIRFYKQSAACGLQTPIINLCNTISRHVYTRRRIYRHTI
jgi:hypothetical protein